MSWLQSLFGRAEKSPLETFNETYARLDWAPEKATDSLKELWIFADCYARGQIYWYRTHASRNRGFAILFRAVAIGGGVTGVTLQIVAVTGAASAETADWTEYSYLAFAIAGAAVLADRWIGSSAAWLRQTSTWLALTKELTEFRFDWALASRKFDEALAAAPANSGVTSAEVEAMVTLLKQFVGRVHEQVRQETEVWAKRFEQITEELGKRVKAEAEATKPGSITVKVEREGRLQEPLTISLDHRDQGDLTGDSRLITSVTPGPHTLAVRGREASLVGQPAGKEVVDSEVVNLAPGANVTVQLKLVSSVTGESED